MFVDLDWPLNASSLLSASAELLVIITQPENWYSFTAPRRVEGWVDLGTAGKVRTAHVQGCKSQWFLRQTQLPTMRFDPRTSLTAVRHATARPLRKILHLYLYWKAMYIFLLWVALRTSWPDRANLSTSSERRTVKTLYGEVVSDPR